MRDKSHKKNLPSGTEKNHKKFQTSLKENLSRKSEKKQVYVQWLRFGVNVVKISHFATPALMDKKVRKNGFGGTTKPGRIWMHFQWRKEKKRKEKISIFNS